LENTLYSAPNYPIRKNLPKWKVQNCEYTKANSDLSTLIELDPNNSLAHFFRGVANTRNNDIAAGIADLSYALELGLPPDLEGSAQSILENLST